MFIHSLNLMGENQTKPATNSGYHCGQSYLWGSGLQPIDWPDHRTYTNVPTHGMAKEIEGGGRKK